MADAAQRMLHGVGTWKDAINTSLGMLPWIGGMPNVARAYLRYGDAVNALKGRVDWRTLPESTLRDIKDWQDMGLVAEVSYERQMQFMNWLRDQMPKAIRESNMGHMISMGFDAAGGWFQKWWFGEVTPRVKFASAMMRRDTLQMLRPELFRDSQRINRLKEYQKFHRDIEGRFGEMHMDNLLWPRIFKQIGVTHLLSLSWKVGFFRTVGDAAHDLTRNVTHWDEIVKESRARGPGSAAAKAFTNRLGFQVGIMTQQALTASAITYLFTKTAPTIWDFFYPRVGKNPDNTDKRVNMQYFMKEWPSLWHYSKVEGSTLGGVARMAGNAISPMPLAVWQAATNKDFIGRTIGDYPARLAYLLQNSYEPISLENMFSAGPKTTTDMVMAGLGYSPSGRWTVRSPLENNILTESLNARTSPQALIDAREQYRQAYLTHDLEGLLKGREVLRKLGATDRQIKNIEKDAHLSTAQKAWKHLPNAKKAEMLKKMSPEERKEWMQLSPHVNLTQ